MGVKKSFVLRIDEDTFKLIEKWADDEFRSVNGQLEWMITKSLKDAKRLKQKSKSNSDKKDIK
ncbi:MAG: Arc family DNA binding domain-containing protein [Bacteroidia bacterium]